MSPDHKAKLETFRTAPEDFARALQSLPREMWQFKPSPERWSVHEIAVHIADSEANSYIRFRKLIAEPGAPLLPYDQDRWANTFQYHERSVEDYQALFGLLRKLSHDLLAAQPESVFANSTTHLEYGTMTLQWYFEYVIAHTPKHIGQMQRNYEAWKEAQGVRG
uniref:Putative metal-dependent hydrolase YfiT n=1 Tax=uncultured bacterium pAW1 TaxID=1781155 RepID=A0A1C9U4N4_9BACT|nr:putative metal-dependent hydrolase YfiT [uncultured bacterium pAW1]